MALQSLALRVFLGLGYQVLVNITDQFTVSHIFSKISLRCLDAVDWVTGKALAHRKKSYKSAQVLHWRPFGVAAQSGINSRKMGQLNKSDNQVSCCFFLLNIAIEMKTLLCIYCRQGSCGWGKSRIKVKI